MPRASATKKPRTSRSTRTKTEVETAFGELAEDTASQETLDPQAALLAGEHASFTRNAVKGLSVDTIVAKGATLGLEIQRTLNNLTEQCVDKAQELKMLQDAIEIETNEIERLYSIDVASAAIKLLIAEHAEKKAALEAEEDALRAAWVEEQSAHTKATRQRDADLYATRQRENSDYEYGKTIERSRKEDEFQRKMALQERDFADKQAAFDKSINDRKVAMDLLEQEFVGLRTRVAGIDQEIAKEVDKHVKIATSSLKRDLEHQHTLEKKDLETKLQLSEAKNVALNESNTKLAEQVIATTKQLDAAREQVQNIAVKSLESASGQMALSKVQETIAQSGNGQRSGNKS
jgi:hypothetical protein